MDNKLAFLLVVIFLILTSCKDQEKFPENPPQINLKTKNLSGSVGDTVMIRAHFIDDYVLKYARLVAPPLEIDTTIYISKKHPPGNALKDMIKSEIDFTYSFTIPDMAMSNKNYDILLRVKDATNKTTEANINLEIK